MDTTADLGQSFDNVFKVGNDTILNIWGEIENLILNYPADVFRFVEPVDILSRIMKNEIDLWIGLEKGEIELAALAQLIGPEHDCYYELFWMGGNNLKTYLESGIRRIESFAMLYGAKSVRMGGRFGWQRLLRNKGYFPYRIELKKDLSYQTSNGRH